MYAGVKLWTCFNFNKHVRKFVQLIDILLSDNNMFLQYVRSGARCSIIDSLNFDKNVRKFVQLTDKTFYYLTITCF